MLQELIQKLQKDHGLSAEQSSGILSTVTNYIKEKIPMMKGTIDNLFSNQSSSTSGSKTEHSIMDKISDVIPGEAGEKVETFAKEAANKAEEMFDSVKGKLGGLFGGNKK